MGRTGFASVQRRTRVLSRLLTRTLLAFREYHYRCLVPPVYELQSLPFVELSHKMKREHQALEDEKAKEKAERAKKRAEAKVR